MAASKKEKPDLQKKVHEVPHKPGVYLMRDRFNRVIYVGKARDLRKRVGSYFLPSKLAQADLKTRAMLEATWNFETHTVRSEAESVLLEGKSREMVAILEDEMRKAAKKMDFEKAAELRNMIDDLRSTTRPMRRFTRGSLPGSIDPMADVHALADALQLPQVPGVMECFDISNISTTHVVASMVCFRDGVPDKDNYRRYRVRTVEGQDDFASMAEVVRRRSSRVLLEARKANSDIAEFSQENAADALARISRHPDQKPALSDSRMGEGIPLQNPEVTSPDSSTPKALAAQNDGGFVAVRLPDLITVDGGKGQLFAVCRELQR